MKNFRKYLFLHLPKTAGKLITSVASKQIPENEHCIFLFDDDFYNEREKLIEQNQYCQCSFFAGHLSYEYVAEIQPDYTFTFLREPIDRVLSQYFYWRQEGLNDEVENLSGETIPLIDQSLSWQEDLLANLKTPYRSFKSLELSNAQTWQLAYNLYKRENLSEEDALNAAKEHLSNFDFVGFYEQLETDLATLFQYQNWQTPTEFPHINQTKSRKKTTDVDDDIINAICSANRLDIELYDYALQHCIKH